MRRLATPGERSLWRALQAGGGAELHITRVVALRGRVNADEFRAAVQIVAHRAPALLANFEEIEGTVWADVPYTGGPVPVEIIRDASDAHIHEFVAHLFDRTVDRAGLRVLLDITEEGLRLVIVGHHLVTDGSTIDSFVREVLRAYAGAARQLPEAAGFTATRAASNFSANSWRSTGIDALVQERPYVPRREGHDHLDTVEVVHTRMGESAALLRRAASADGLSFAQALMTSFVACLHAWTNAEGLVFVTPVDVRERIDRYSWGMGVNSVPIRSRLLPGQSWREFARALRATSLDGYRQRHVALTDVADTLRLPRRSDGSSALTDFEFNVTPAWAPPEELVSRKVTAKAHPQIVTRSQYDVSLSAIEGSDDVELCWQIRGGPSAHDTAMLLDSLFIRFAKAWAHEPDGSVVAVSLMDVDLERELISAGAGPDLPIDPRTAAERFLAQASQKPEALAVVTATSEITYGELAHKAEAFRVTLAAAGVHAGDRVAVNLERGVDLVVALVALWASGAVYVPIDRGNPPPRVAAMLRDTAPKVVVTEDATDSDLADITQALNARLITVPKVAVTSGGEEPWRSSDGRSPVYVMFTSGSTGQPKGLEVHLEGFSNHLDEMIRAVGMNSSDVFGQLAPLGFDVHIWQLVAPLVVGATLRIYSGDELRDPIELARLARADRVSILQAVPSYLEQWCHLAETDQRAASARDLRALFVTGEAFPSELATRLRILFPDTALINAYGPAEASDDVSLHRCETDDRGGVVPIGRPVANTRVYVLDRWQRLRPPGFRGELAVGGVAVGNGYLKIDERQAFRPDPRMFEGRMYLTGDVCSMADGVLRFHGRMDHQVKLGGRRVELEEIENACLTLDGVSAAAVSVVRMNNAEALIGFLVGTTLAETSELRAALRRLMPVFMVPGTLVVCDALPLTANGKVDRDTLAVRSEEIFREREGLGGTNEAMRGIWENVLGVAGVVPSDNFFALGGDSLKVMQLVAELRRHGLPAEIAQLYAAPTLEAFAELAVVESSDEPFRGQVRLPPFVQRHLRAEAGFAQAVRCLVASDSEHVETALATTIRRHPVLNMRMVSSPDGWLLAGTAGLSIEGVTVGSTAELEHAAIGHVSTSRLFSWASTPTADGVELCMAAHHAVFDQQSWLIVLADFDRALRGQALPPAEWAFPNFCSQEDRLAEATEAPVVKKPTTHVQRIVLEIPTGSELRRFEATVLAAVARWIGAASNRATVGIAAEHDLRFARASKARGVGCYVDLVRHEVDISSEYDDLISASLAILSATAHPARGAEAIDVVVNRVVPAADLGSHVSLSEVRWARSITRHNAATAPAAVVVDLEYVAAEKVLVVTLTVTDLVNGASTTIPAVERDVHDRLARKHPVALDGADLLDMGTGALTDVLRLIEETGL
jgi:amino acid adenylation domain-containing protein